MKTAIWVSLTLSILALAGCTEEVVPLTEDDCLVQGLILDPAVEQVDNETGETFIGPACVENIPSVTVTLEGLPATSPAWTPVDLTWRLHTTLDEDHSHNNGVRVSTTSEPAYLGKVDGYGDGLLDGKEEHRNFVEGDSSTVTWTPEAPGTYYVRAYAVSSWGTFWAEEHEVTITEVQPTGTGHEVTITGGGIPSVTTLDPADLEIALGDEVSWTTGDPGVTWTVTRTNGPKAADPFSTTAGGDAVLFTVPGQYTYKAESELGDVVGTITVAFPE